MGNVCIVYGETSEGSGPKFPPPSPLDPPLVIEVANVDSTNTDGDRFLDEFYKLMLISQYFITQR